MDIEFIVNLSIRCILIGTLLQGLGIIYTNLPKDRIVRLFTSLLILFIISFTLGSINLILNDGVKSEALVMLNSPKMTLATATQLYMQYFIYSLVFPARKAAKYATYQAIPLLAILIIIYTGEKNELFAQVLTSYDDSSLKELITCPIFLLKSSVILLQFFYTIMTLFTTSRLIKIYQHYIYCTESNTSRNVTWINSILRLFFFLSLTYTLNAFISNSATAILYFLAALHFFIHTISKITRNYSSQDSLSGELYTKIGVKRSVGGIWQVLDKRNARLTMSDKATFNAIDRWIDESKAYTNADFSFKNLVEVFPDLDYNHLNDLLNKFCNGNFQSYIRDKRIDYAIRLMDETQGDAQIKSIAYNVGFESNSSFARAFKAAKGVTASEWRKSTAPTKA